MYPGHHATLTPDKPALIMAATGEVITYKQLDERSNRLANLWFEQGLRPNDHVAIFARNDARYIDVLWAAMRSGLHLTPVNCHLSADEAHYIVTDCGADALIVDASLDTAAPLVELCDLDHTLSFGGEIGGVDDYDEAVGAQPTTPLEEQPSGMFMMYSSGTTGKPKGITRPLSGKLVSDDHQFIPFLTFFLGMSADSVYLSPAPIYHAAPLGYIHGVQALGATAVVMDRFTPVSTLEAIEQYGVTHGQFVPTMFVRMLKLDDVDRTRPDVSSLEVAIHAAAPCPVDVKRKMIEWWGPKLVEYYGGTEGVGLTVINSEHWLEHPGSVGQAISGTLRICDDIGDEVAAGEHGTVYFENEAASFEYHGDKEKTAAARHPAYPTWATLGDVGYVDEDGFLYLTDRKAFMIISGGVNIYPQEIEDCLALHPKVADIAVFGLPDPEMGEFVQAVVEVAPDTDPGPELAEELRLFVRERVAHYKVPRHFAFHPELPRLPTGKLYKKQLREEFLNR